MQLVLGLIMLRVDLAPITPDNFPAVFLTQLVCIIFLSAFGDILQTEMVWMTISNYLVSG